MIVRTIKRGKDGVKQVFVTDMRTGETTCRSKSKSIRPGMGNYYQISSSNGVPTAQVQKARDVDRQLGVPITYLTDGPISYAAFDTKKQKNDWLRAHRRVDHDAGYGDPAPGDFSQR